MQVFLCDKDGKVFNALVVAAAGDTGVYLLAATSSEGLNAKGAHLLQWRAMEWLKSRGCRWYELGGVNPEKNPGVFQFKNGMGGEDVRQIGAFELSESWMGTACVRSGEQLQSVAQRVRSWTERIRL
jgi:lipid II:glycine glycyltransferase (peptidoglycan interpeptide bridge formation enzyme)